MTVRDPLDIAEAMHKRRNDIERLRTTPGLKRLARLIAYYGVRNSELEDLHAGGDHSKVPWEAASRISDPEMRSLMLSIEHEIGEYLAWLILNKVIRVTERSVSALELGDWHSIMALGPTYDRAEDPPEWAE